MDASEAAGDRLTPVYPTPKNQPLLERLQEVTKTIKETRQLLEELRLSIRWYEAGLLILLVGQIAAFVVLWNEAHKEQPWPTNNQHQLPFNRCPP